MLDSLSPLQKQILTIAVFILATLLMAWVVWMLLLRPLNQSGPIQNSNGNLAVVNGTLPNINDGQGLTNRTPLGNTNQNLPTISEVATGGETLETEITDHSTANLHLGANGVQFYNEDDQRFYRIDANGQVIRLSDQQFFEATDVTFSPDGLQAIISYPDTYNILYRFSSGQQITLPKEMNEFSFSKDGSQIAFEFEVEGAPEQNFIGISNPDGTQIQAVEPLGEKEADVSIEFAPHQEVVATYREGVDGDRQEVFFIGKNNENFPSLKTSGRNFEGRYSPTGRQMLYSVYNAESNYQPELHLVNAQGNNIGTGNLNLGIKTWSDKCAFGSGTTIYCAVPTNLERGAGLYRELADDNPDEIVRIDTATGLHSRIAIPVDANRQNASVVDQLVVSPDESMLYYTDSKSKELKGIRLK